MQATRSAIERRKRFGRVLARRVNNLELRNVDAEMIIDDFSKSMARSSKSIKAVRRVVHGAFVRTVSRKKSTRH